jgi:hypothetical protein
MSAIGGAALRSGSPPPVDIAGVAQIGSRIIARPRRPLPGALPGLSSNPYDVSGARSGAGMTRGQ